MKKLLILTMFVSLFALSACASKTAENAIQSVPSVKVVPTTEKIATETPAAAATETPAALSVGIANPASVNCEKQGGTLKIVTRGDGGQYGICYFEDNRQCEEWALMRGDCPIGGRKITGYDNDQQAYCAITGGEVNMKDNTCTIKGKACDLKNYYNGDCPAS